MDYTVVSRPLASGQWIAEPTRKTGIVIHFTAGNSVEGALEEWDRTPERVGTAYIIDRAGTVFQTFPEDEWAYHLGLPKEVWTHGNYDKATIGIELVNFGPLALEGKQLLSWPGKFSTPYCSIEDVSLYHRGSNYRGYLYYASFTEEQYVSLRKLVDDLTANHPIPRTFLDPEKRIEYYRGYLYDFHGITTHANWRADKFDVGPAFEWEKII